jgi:ubiquinone/menaquinone biosynthesis C-methylase UbiE
LGCLLVFGRCLEGTFFNFSIVEKVNFEMIKVGHHLTDQEIGQKYDLIADSPNLKLPAYFYKAVADFVEGENISTILDLGCGDGDLLSHLLEKLPSAKLVGTEISFGRLVLARERLLDNAYFLQMGTKGHLPFDDNSIDLVFVTEVIEHLKTPVVFLKEVKRVLSAKGKLILTTPNSDAYPLWNFFAVLQERGLGTRLLKHFLPFEHPLKTIQPIDTVLSYNEVEDMLSSAEFNICRIQGRELAPFLFSMPGFRGLDYRNIISRAKIDSIANELGFQRRCYRLFWECTKRST